MRNITLLFVLLVLLFSCNSGGEDQIDIGLLSVFSGEGAHYGETAKTGVQLAVDEINQDGGINGKKIKIIYEDSKGTPKEAVNGFQKLVTANEVPAILGPFYSGQVLACAPIANETETILFTGSATSDNITNAGEFVFRTCPTNLEQSRTAAKFILDSLKDSTSFIIYRNRDYGVTLRDAFIDEYSLLGGKVLGFEGIEAEANDLRTQLLLVKNSGAKNIFAAVHYPEGGNLLNQAKEIGLNASIVGTDGGFSPELFEIAGKSANDTYWLTIGWNQEKNSDNVVQKFKNNYQQKFGKEPGVYSGLYYDAMCVLGLALKNAESDDSEKIRKELQNINYNGATGTTHFDENGDVQKPYSVYKIINKKFKQIK